MGSAIEYRCHFSRALGLIRDRAVQTPLADAWARFARAAITDIDDGGRRRNPFSGGCSGNISAKWSSCVCALTQFLG